MFNERNCIYSDMVSLPIIPSKLEVIDRCGRDEKIEWPRRTDKSRTL